MRTPVLFLLLAGCASEIDTTGLPSVAGYESWHQQSFPAGEIPGHGDSYRIVFVNDVARAYPHGGRYPLGSVLVKEIHKNDNGLPGDLRYLAIMRKLGDDSDQPTDAGWLFTYAVDRGGAEHHLGSCWSTCHQVGPYDGTWSDYGER